MTRDEKIQQAFRFVEVIVGGYSSHNTRPSGIIMSVWTELFENCYKGVEAMLAHADKIDPPGEPKARIIG